MLFSGILPKFTGMLLKFSFGVLIKSWCLLFLLVYANQAAYAEEVSSAQIRGSAVEIGFHVGKILKHREYFKPEVRGNTFLGEIAWLKQTNGDRHWHKPLNYPVLGTHLIFGGFGDRYVFGRTVTLAGSVSFSLWRSKFVDLDFRVLTGIGYVDRPYHPVDNPTNNVIGSKLNNYSAFKLGLNWKPLEYWTFSTAVQYHHFSNGNFQKYNLGINAPVFVLSTRYHYEGLIDLKSSESPEFRQFGFQGRIGFGMNESGQAGGPKYPVYKTTLQGSWNSTAVNRVLLGFDLTYDTGTREFLIFQEIADGSEAKWDALSGSVVIGNELLLGKLGLVTQLGVYVFSSEIRTHRIYSNVGLQFYPLAKPNTYSRGFFIGSYLKSHKAVADVIEFAIGWSF